MAPDSPAVPPVTPPAASPAPAAGGLARRGSALLHRHARLRLTGLLAAPVAWLVVVYLGSLALLFASSVWTVDSFTGSVIHTFTLDNFRTLFSESVYRTIVGRTLLIAAVVTVIDLVLALPLAFYMAKVARPWAARLLVVAVLTPLWSNYLVKAYAWRIMFSSGGLVDWLTSPFGLSTPGFGVLTTTIVLAYLWLPYMVLPVYAGLDRLPDSLLDASGDLGARPWHTFRRVVLPLIRPAIVAGSVFTFSLSLGDYIAVQIVGGSTQMIGNVVYANIGTAGNLPFAAALALVPVLVMVIVLVGARRTGALEEM